MISLARATRIVVCTSSRATPYGIARAVLRYHDGTLHHDGRMYEVAPVHSQPIVRIGLPSSTRRELARTPAATTITKSP